MCLNDNVRIFIYDTIIFITVDLSYDNVFRVTLILYNLSITTTTIPKYFQIHIFCNKYAIYHSLHTCTDKNNNK